MTDLVPIWEEVMAKGQEATKKLLKDKLKAQPNLIEDLLTSAVAQARSSAKTPPTSGADNPSPKPSPASSTTSASKASASSFPPSPSAGKKARSTGTSKAS